HHASRDPHASGEDRTDRRRVVARVELHLRTEAPARPVLMSRIDDLISELTLEKKIALCHGSDFMSTTPVPEAVVPRMWVTDGPHGARGRGWGNTTSASIPCGTALGATWDADLLYQVGELMGNQVRS